MRIAPLLLFPLLLLHQSLAVGATSATTPWQNVTSSNGSSAQPRHESGAVSVDGKLYLLGGRAVRNIQVFDPVAQTWTDLAPMPMELHHFQPVVVEKSIYVIGGFTCCYPNEDTVYEIHVFDTQTLTWSIQGSMPGDRGRGSAAAVARDGMIYLLGGNTLGHAGGAVAWFDKYDPATGAWSQLPDAPNARDHFAAVLVNDYLVAAAGRQTNQPNPFKNTVVATDVFDFVSGEWQSGDAIPTARAGALAGAAGDEVIVAGGEINTSTTALSAVEAFNVYSGKWRALQPLNIGRHSGGGVAMGGKFHVLAGSMNTGGAPETNSHETLLLDEIKSLDFDADGLSNSDERSVHSTDPDNADTDFDNLQDYEEIFQHQSDPLLPDSDGDSIRDGDEVNVWNTSPTSTDTDNDGLSDDAEAFTHNTNPLLADTDGDQLSDAEELETHLTDALNVDTDADGVNDGEEVENGLNPLDSDSDDDGIVDGLDSYPLGGEAPVVDNSEQDEQNSESTDENNADTAPVNSDSNSSGNVSLLLLTALLVGRLSRIRLRRVNVTTNFFIN